MNKFKELKDTFEKWHHQEIGSFELETKCIRLLESLEAKLEEFKNVKGIEWVDKAEILIESKDLLENKDKEIEKLLSAYQLTRPYIHIDIKDKEVEEAKEYLDSITEQ